MAGSKNGVEEWVGYRSQPEADAALLWPSGHTWQWFIPCGDDSERDIWSCRSNACPGAMS